ncbi:PREDICTED: UDP-glucuronosyltransferase 2B31-like [Acromyrmex echinatior]|uniref:UDP-glucuronosyltransferase 2B31-like n=1 Tax=Acromyrmex echinatior TaxID=103372 RepID=UPI000580D9AD|nr:PREDICTED: UDP-glucuronosyltransferase 2B31-like [Acromyrmex echinatior]
MPIMQGLAEKYVGHTIRPLHEIGKNINILLLNSHPAFDYGIPLPPNTLEIAGLNAQTIKPIDGEIVITYSEIRKIVYTILYLQYSKKQLCLIDMRAFLDGAKNGVIIISLGTNVKWKFIGLDKVMAVLLALSKLKQRVIWKLDIEVPFEIPDNLMIVKWMPQNEILSHKNVRAIWTHGGLLSTQEAIWKGVPMIVMPFCIDQKFNAQKVIAKNAGIYLDIKTLSTQIVLHAVEEILYNERYMRNMKQLSSEFRDRPIPPIDLAVWGIEYAVRHPNGTLVTPLRYQSWMEQNLIDVYAFLFFNFIVILLSIVAKDKSVLIDLIERLYRRFYAMMLNCFTLLFYLVCYILMSFVTTSKALSILLLEPIPSTSHHVWAENLIKGLLREGHHVHITSIHETKIEGKLAQNLTYAIFDDVMKTYEESEDYNPSEWEQYSVFYMGYFTYQWGINACEAMTKTKAAKELLEMIKNVEFDVIVQDITLTQCFYGLWEIAKGKPPIVGYIPFGPAPWLKDFIGGPSYPTVRPYTHAAIAKPVDLWQRTWNTLYYIMDDLIRHYYFLPAVQRLAEKYVGHAIRPLYEIEKDSINIVLINSHPAFDSGIPLPPNTLEIAGLNAQPIKSIVDEVVVTYPENVRVFLDGATNGALVISLGTNVKWKSIGLDKVKTVILALSKLKQRILWKLDIDVPFEVPDNLMTMKWIMQKEVLSHKNVRAIWTHGGLLSTQEAIWKGIPVIVMPFFMDQKSNAQILVAKGVGIYLDVKTLSTQTILHAVEEIFYNESYTKNMKQLSSEFRDRQILPLDLAIWSIEYTVRHPNGTLVTPLKFQSRIQQNLIDVYVFLFFNIIIILLTIFFAIKILIYFYYNHIYIRHLNFTKANSRKSR